MEARGADWADGANGADWAEGADGADGPMGTRGAGMKPLADTLISPMLAFLYVYWTDKDLCMTFESKLLYKLLPL